MRAFFLFLALCLAGCSTVSQTSQNYRARGEDQLSTITGILTYNPMATSDIEILIGGTSVAFGHLGTQAQGVANGRWKEKDVSAECARIMSVWSSSHTIKCTVVVGGEMAASLTFNPF